MVATEARPLLGRVNKDSWNGPVIKMKRGLHIFAKAENEECSLTISLSVFFFLPSSFFFFFFKREEKESKRLEHLLLGASPRLCVISINKGLPPLLRIYSCK